MGDPAAAGVLEVAIMKTTNLKTFALLAAFGMSLVGFAASWLKAVFFADNLALNGFFLFLGKWVFDLIFLIVGRGLHGAELAMQIFVWSPLSAAVTAVAGVLALSILRPLMEVRTQ